MKKQRKNLALAGVGGLALAAVFGLALVEATDSVAEQKLDARSYYQNYVETEDNGQLRAIAAESTTAVDSDGGPVTEPSGPPVLYEDYGKNKVELATESPLSTFALDVDTGSFYLAYEQLVNAGLPLGAGQIRVEEWLNSFSYGDKRPTNGPFAVSAEVGDSSTAGKKIVRIAVAGQEVKSNARGTNVTVVVDTSGSMNIQNRLGLVQSSVALLANNLDSSDTISLVTFENDARVVLKPTAAGDKDRIATAIEELTSGGGTNLEAGLVKAYELARKSFDRDKNNIVLLASDGVANIGNTTAKSIEANAKEGIHLVTVGYGMGNYSDQLMEQLANRGDGFYSYLNTYEETERFFTEDIDKITTPIAKEVKAQVEWNPAAVESYRLVGYENRMLSEEDWDDESADAGEFSSGHTAVAVYEFTSRSDSESYGHASVRWQDIRTGETSTAIVELTGGGASPSLALVNLVKDTADLVDKLSSGKTTYSGEAVKILLAQAAELKDPYPEVEKIEDILSALELVYGKAPEIPRPKPEERAR